MSDVSHRCIQQGEQNWSLKLQLETITHNNNKKDARLYKVTF